MEISYQHSDIENHQIKIDLEVPFKELESEFNKKLDDYSKMIQLPGFRKGKVPKNIVKNKFQVEIEEEVVKKVLEKAVNQIIEKKEVDFFGSFRLGEKEENKLKYVNNQPLKISLLAYKKPECIIKKISDLKVKEKKVVIRDSDINLVKDQILSQHGNLESVKEGPFKFNDLIYISVIFMDKDFEKFNIKEHVFYYSEERKGALPEYLNYFYDELVTLKIGEEKKALISFPEIAKDEVLKNKKLEVNIKLNNLKRTVKAKLDGELLKKLGFESEKDFTNKIKSNLTEIVKEKIKQEKEDSLLTAIKENTIFKVPEIAYDNIVLNSWYEQKKRYSNSNPNQKLDLPKNPSAEWAKKARLDAINRLQNEMVLSKIKEENEVAVGEEELQGEIRKLAEQSKKDEKEFRKELIKSGNYSNLRQNLVMEKVFDFLYEKNKIIDDGEYPVKKIINNH